MKKPKFLLLALFVTALILVAVDFLTTTRIVSISNTHGLDAHAGVITVEYSRPVRVKNSYQILKDSTGGQGLASTVDYSADGQTEYIRLTKPTTYNEKYHIVRRSQKPDYLLFGWFLPDRLIEISTGFQQVKVVELLPSEGSRPSPEAMNNQYSIEFCCEVMGKYRKDVNIPPEEMEYVRNLTPLKGYFRWVNPKLLTFNFTEDRPQYETEYGFEIFPDQFIDKNRQVWAEKQTKFTFRTATYEVYVADFSLKNEVGWKDELRIEFSGPMVGPMEILRPKDQSVVPIKISPKAGGTWQWANARSLEFHPDEETGWPARQKITVEIRPEINTEKLRKWRNGNKPEIFSFDVLPREQRIDSFSLRGDRVDLDKDLIVEFSRDMVAQESIRVGFKNSSAAANIPFLFVPEIDGEFYWLDGRKLRFRPSNLWSELTEYKVTLNKKFNPDPRYEWAGANEFRFKTVENLVMAEFFMTPEEGISGADFYNNKSSYRNFTDVKPEDRLWILFDKALGRFIKPEFDMSQAVVVEPAIPGKFKWLSNELLEFKPDGDWREGVEYRVKLTKKLLHHPEQHFPAETDVRKFVVGKNETSIKSDLIKAGDSEVGALVPTEAMTFEFSRNMKPGLTVGKSYSSSQIEASAMGFMMEPKAAFRFRWETARKLIITPETYWPPETAFTLTFADGLRPTKENRYRDSPVIRFRTERNFLSIESIRPLGEVEKSPRFEVRFDRNIRPSGVENGRSEEDGLFSFKPELKGRWLWTDENQLAFDPSEELKPSSSYELIFNPGKVKDKQFTVSKDHDKSYNFFTQPIHVKSSTARFEVDEKNVLKQKFYLDFTLSEPVKIEDFKKHFSIWFEEAKRSGEILQIPLTYKVGTRMGAKGTQDGIHDFYVESDWIERPADDRKIYYKITQGLAPIVGNLTLEPAYESDFLQEKPKNIKIDSLAWSLEHFQYKAGLSLNAPVDPEKLKKSLTVESKNKKIDFAVSVSPNSSLGKYRYEIKADFKAGRNYEFAIKKGVLAEDGAFAVDDLTHRSDAPDFKQEIDFAFNGSYLSQKDLEKIPVVTTNVKSVKVSIVKVFKNNVRYFLNNNLDKDDISSIGKEIISKDFAVAPGQNIENERVVTHIDMAKLFAQNRHGVYVVCLGTYYCQKRRWFVSTDIGLVARKFGQNLLVWANSLYSAAPQAGMKVSAIDAWNQEIASGETDSQGVAKITLPKGQSVEQVIATKGEDLSFVSLGHHRDSLREFETEGIKTDSLALRTYVYSDRGVYRPGEVVHLVAVTREKNGVTLDGKFPLQLKLLDPSGREVLIEKYSLAKEGVFVFDYHVPDDAKTGKWRAISQFLGPRDSESIGQYEFQIEEFIPSQIKVGLQLLTQDLRPGKKLRFKVSGKNLFGPPAVQKVVSGEVKLRAFYFKPKGYTDYRFGHEDTEFQRIDFSLSETKLDAAGEHIYEYEIPRGIVSPIGLQAHYSATVLDDGGRGVAEYAEAPIFLYDQYVGIKKVSEGPHMMGSPIILNIVSVDRFGSPTPRAKQKLTMSLYERKDVTHYRKNERGYYRYITEKQNILIGKVEDTRDENNQLRLVPERPGSYSLEVSDEIGGQITKIGFSVESLSQSRPILDITDRVLIRPLKSMNFVGDEMQVELQTPFPGKLLLTGERGEVLFSRVIDMKETSLKVNVPIKKEYLPNIYLSAVVVRPVSLGNRIEPIYARGLANIAVSDRSHYPKLELAVPDRISPNSELTVNVSVDDIGTKEMYLTVAAVDEGILGLTKFETPSMRDYFNQKQRLLVDHFSMYHMVMPFDPEVKRSIDPSGDAPSRALIKKSRVNPDGNKRVQTVALWSGLVKFGKDGKAKASLKVPDFNGSLRVMAVAFGDQRFASGAKNVVVKDRLILRPSLPRFLATGDQFLFPVTVFNETGDDQDVEVGVRAKDLIEFIGPQKVSMEMKRGEEKQVYFTAKVLSATGVADVTVTANGGSFDSKKIVHIPVRTPGTYKTVSGGGSVDQGSPKTLTFPKGFMPGTRELALVVTGNAMLRFKNSLKYLLTYPHGCLEQTASKIFPLLYYSDLVTEEDRQHLTAEKNPRFFVKEGISRIERMQLEGGGLPYWPGASTVNGWTHVYASHLLVEAKNKGFPVGEATWNNMLRYLEELGKKTDESGDYNHNYRRNIDVRLYALYVLALAGENVLAKANQIYDNDYGDLKGHEKARLAHVFSLSGEKETAEKILDSVAGFSEYSNPYRDTGGNFSSDVRDLSIILEAAAHVAPGSPKVEELASILSGKAAFGRWGTTHDNALALLALGKTMAGGGLRPKGKVILGDGGAVDVTHRLVFKTVDLDKGDVRIEVDGKGELSFAWEAVGIEEKTDALLVDRKLKARKRYLDKDGKEVDLNDLKQGDLVVVEISAEALGGKVDNVAIMDLLPAGLEIENGRLASSSAISWVKEQVEADYTDIRDDRISLYTNLSGAAKKFYYTARAVTLGSFSLPPVHAEAMYDPGIVSRSGFGKIRVVTRNE